MKTKELKILSLGGVDRGYGNDGIRLDSIFSVEKVNDDLFTIREECDGHYDCDLTKDEMLLMIEELKDWVEKQSVIQK